MEFVVRNLSCPKELYVKSAAKGDRQDVSGMNDDTALNNGGKPCLGTEVPAIFPVSTGVHRNLSVHLFSRNETYSVVQVVLLERFQRRPREWIGIEFDLHNRLPKKRRANIEIRLDHDKALPKSEQTFRNSAQR